MAMNLSEIYATVNSQDRPVWKYSAGMATRREKLVELIAARFGGNQAEFARAIKRAPAQVNHWVTGYRALGDAGARNTELAIGLPQGYFDSVTHLPSHESSATAEVVRLMAATDDTGRAIALSHVQVALRAYAEGTKKMNGAQ